jgi:ssDNA-binding Zn-finger/Zn-ribbon topoisomerase 1
MSTARIPPDRTQGRFAAPSAVPICRVCGAPKEHRGTGRDGRWICISCERERKAAWYHRNKPPVVPRQWRRTPLDDIAPAQRSRRAWDRNNPEKRRAQKAVERALATGQISRHPCEWCGAEKTQAHHDDYSKPLAVAWLCQSCHKRRHRELGAQASAKARSGGSLAEEGALCPSVGTSTSHDDDWRGGPHAAAPLLGC